MEKSYLTRRWLSATLLLFVTAFLLGGCRLSLLQPATTEMLDTAEANWLASPTASYRMTVEIERPGERRRSTVVVENHEIVSGSVAYWDNEQGAWQEPYALNQDQSYPFSVPGLFDMIRGELEMSGRKNVRVLTVGDPPFPYNVHFGPVIVDGKPFPATKATVTIVEFAPR